FRDLGEGGGPWAIDTTLRLGDNARMGDTAAALPTLGWGSLAMSFASLGLVCVLAYVALKWLAGRGVGRALGAVKVLARCPLEPRPWGYLLELSGARFP